MLTYRRVSTAEQAESQAGLDAQRAAILAEAGRRGCSIAGEFSDEGLSGRSLNGRLGLSEALSALRRGEADALVVARLDRLSRSLVDSARLLEQARREKWALVALDLGIDTTTSAGELVASVMASVAAWEGRVIGERTRDALAARRAAGRNARPSARIDRRDRGSRQSPTGRRHDVAADRRTIYLVGNPHCPGRNVACRDNPEASASRQLITGFPWQAAVDLPGRAMASAAGYEAELCVEPSSPDAGRPRSGDTRGSLIQPCHERMESGRALDAVITRH